MAPLIQMVIDIVGWTFVALAVGITPILAAAMIMRQLRWVGFDVFDKEAPE